MVPTKSTPPERLPNVRQKSRRRRKTNKTFAELLRQVGGEEATFKGLSGTKREILVRMVYEILLEGKLMFPDGREIQIDWDRWERMFWDIVKHLDITSVFNEARENGVLTAGALTTNVILYLPANGRDIVSAKTVYQDDASRNLGEMYPIIGAQLGINGHGRESHEERVWAEEDEDDPREGE